MIAEDERLLLLESHDLTLYSYLKRKITLTLPVNDLIITSHGRGWVYANLL